MSTAAIPIPQCLWTTVCPNCGYSLQGATSTGICPECGGTYDQTEVVLHGHGRGSHENVATAKRSRIALLILFSILWGLVQAGQFYVFNRRASRWSLVWLGLLFVPALYRLIRRGGAGHPGLVQIRLNSYGCVQYDDLAGPSIVRELIRAHVWIIPVVTTIAFLAGYWKELIDGILFWCFFPFALILSVYFVAKCWAFRRDMRKVRDGSIADLNAAFCKPTRWSDVSNFDIRRLSGGAVRIRIQKETRFLSIGPPWPVDAEIVATDDQFEQLHDLIQQWINRSGTK